MNTIPMVIKRTAGGERAVDIFSLLIENRTVSLFGEVNDASAEIVMAELLYLDSVSNEPVMLYINSPGGSVTAGMCIHDTMKNIKSPVYTICTGMAASMGAFLLASGDRRMCTPNAEVMIHQPLGGTKGQASDIAICAEHILRTRKRLNGLLSLYTGKDLSEIEKDTDRDNYMTAEEALSYGLIDEIIDPPKAPGKR